MLHKNDSGTSDDDQQTTLWYTVAEGRGIYNIFGCTCEVGCYKEHVEGHDKERKPPNGIQPYCR